MTTIGEQTVKQSREVQLGEHIQEGGMQYGQSAYCGSRTVMRFKFISRNLTGHCKECGDSQIKRREIL